jgi:ATP-binding cassette subfamily C protein CydD
MLGIDKRLMVRSTRRWIFIGIGVGIITLLTSLYVYFLIGQLIDGMVSGNNLFVELLPVIAVALVMKLGFGWLYRFAQYKASAMTKLSLRDLIYRHALKLGPAVLDKKRTGELVNTAVDGMDWIELFYGVYFVQFVVGMATPLVLCIFVGILDWVVGLAVLVSVPLTPMFLGMMAKNFTKSSKRYTEVNDEQSAQFLDSIQGMPTLKMFNMGKHRGADMHKANETQRQETMKLLLVNQIMILLVDFGFALGTTMVMVLVALWRIDAGALTAGATIAMILASAEFAKPLTLIGEFFFAGAVGREYAKKILAFLAEPPTVQDPVDVKTPAKRPNPILELRNISFSYANSKNPAVDNFSLTINPGETVAIVGQSGSGKTTVTNLLLRTLQPSSGSISLDGIDTDHSPSDWLREHIALVPQDPYLFYGTIGDNLRVAKPNATEDELIAATRSANIYEQINKLPERFNTMVGERGLSLSGGQVQRLAIARALLKNAPIVVLDEPTSQIDLETEAVIHEALEQLAKNKTVILVAHRLSTVENADRIVVMGNGRIIEVGSHAELLARNGQYARMINTGDKTISQLETIHSVGGAA